ncbi:unnamed protein product, partial [Lampetra fluviatilis]
MAAASSKAVLKRILTKYKHKDVALKDVVAVTEIFPNLIPSQDTYSCVYNIPVELWLLDSHPAHPPLCFVRPTASMMIRTSRRVDSNGRVYLPCLSQWGAASDLLVLVQVMCAEFGEEPPVLSLGRATSPPQLSRSGTVTHEHLHASLVSAIGDQLRRRGQEAQGRARAELAALQRTHSELSGGRERLQFLLSALARET